MRKVYIRTFGCQMNKRDSEIISSLLAADGYEPTSRPEDADLVLFNTCCVREHADRRVYGKVAELRLLKERRPEMVLAVVGCLAERDREKLLERLPHLDLVAGTGSLYELPQLIAKARQNGNRVLKAGTDRPIVSQAQFADREPGIRGWVTISEGCNNYCAYCVVPYVRGPERSKNPEIIVDEVQRMVAGGFVEVCLLGQNVNSYGHDLSPQVSFHDLLARLDSVDGLARIRFTTSHPKDLSEELVNAMADLPKVCEHIHLPVQAGSDKILGLMNRRYTRAQYLDRVARLRERMAGIAITTDIIVGFPGEEEEDFRATCELVREARFDGAYIFKYSPRPGTAVSMLPGVVPKETIAARHTALLELQKEISLEKSREMRGKLESVLIEEISSAGDAAKGKTRNNKVAVVRPTNVANFRIGDEVPVRIVEVKDWTLYAEPDKA